MLTEQVRTLLPHIVRLGLATAEQVDIESLERRLRDEAIATRLTAFSGRVVGAWANEPLLDAKVLDT
jgi:hypothetical protein